MKGIDFSEKAKGQSLSPDYTDDLQESTRAKFESLIKALTVSSDAVVILHGCEVTVDGDDYSMTAGVVYYQGRIYTAPVFDLTTAEDEEVPVWTLQKTYTGQARYGDNVLRDTFFDDQIILQMGASGSGIADYDEVETLIKADNKPNTFIDLTLLNDAARHGGAGYPSGHPTPGYFIDGMGFVHLYGFIDVGTDPHIATLPVGFRPPIVWAFGGTGFEIGSDVNPAYIDTDGKIYAGDADAVNLSNISFPTY